MKRKDESRGQGHRSESSRQRIEMVDDRSRKDTSGDEKSLSKKKRASPVPSRSSRARDKDRKDDRTEKKREKTHSDKKKLPSEEKVGQYRFPRPMPGLCRILCRVRRPLSLEILIIRSVVDELLSMSRDSARNPSCLCTAVSAFVVRQSSRSNVSVVVRRLESLQNWSLDGNIHLKSTRCVSSF